MKSSEAKAGSQGISSFFPHPSRESTLDPHAQTGVSPFSIRRCRRMVVGKNNALEIQMTKRGGRSAIYQIKAVVQSNTRPCRQWKRQFIFNIKEGRPKFFVTKRIRRVRICQECRENFFPSFSSVYLLLYFSLSKDYCRK